MWSGVYGSLPEWVVNLIYEHAIEKLSCCEGTYVEKLEPKSENFGVRIGHRDFFMGF